MVRLIKRYGGGSRKLYDTEESRYVSLDQIADWVRAGQQLRVVDSKTGENVTAQTLAQVIYEGERRGISLVPTEILHEVIRRGGRAVQKGVERFQDRVDRLVRAGMDRVKPLQEARQEMSALRQRLEQLEHSLGALEGNGGRAKGTKRARQAKRTKR
ncbi:MAG TPA: polyhydroxyalkanoate synthesis regulator DNA-binding domain-containing protein [Gemmatimonadales bacterium]|nr:polyhydroxyalkanoate synthesis regulator DNA-binding domain-containing protein [Gemmatimonadales bacterium]